MLYIESLRYETCGKCLILLPHHKLKKCAKCLQKYYCSRDCQKNDWKDHKIDCKNNSFNMEDLRQSLVDNMNFITSHLRKNWMFQLATLHSLDLLFNKHRHVCVVQYYDELPMKNKEDQVEQLIENASMIFFFCLSHCKKNSVSL